MNRKNIVSAIIILLLLITLVYYYRQNQTKLSSTNEVSESKETDELDKDLEEFESILAELTKQSENYEAEIKHLQTKLLDQNRLEQKISTLEKENQALSLKKAGDWAINRIQELETSLRTKETKLQSLEKALRRVKK